MFPDNCHHLVPKYLGRHLHLNELNTLLWTLFFPKNSYPKNNLVNCQIQNKWIKSFFKTAKQALNSSILKLFFSSIVNSNFFSDETLTSSGWDNS